MQNELVHSAFIIHRFRHYAAIAPPPGMLVPTGVDAGPFCLRGLNQNAVNHTFAPGATLAGKVTSTTVFEVMPSLVHPVSTFGGVSPTKLHTLAPSTPTG